MVDASCFEYFSIIESKKRLWCVLILVEEAPADYIGIEWSAKCLSFDSGVLMHDRVCFERKIYIIDIFFVILAAKAKTVKSYWMFWKREEPDFRACWAPNLSTYLPVLKNIENWSERNNVTLWLLQDISINQNIGVFNVFYKKNKPTCFPHFSKNSGPINPF